jgi:hypothetical protein
VLISNTQHAHQRARAHLHIHLQSDTGESTVAAAAAAALAAARSEAEAATAVAVGPAKRRRALLRGATAAGELRFVSVQMCDVFSVHFVIYPSLNWEQKQTFLFRLLFGIT